MHHTDRELLELAAAAAGMTGMRWAGPSGLHKMIDPSRPDSTGSIGAAWNPLTSDGDALRLAVKLGMMVDQTDDSVDVLLPSRTANETTHCEPHGSDPCSATRRAIVRAAAEIGRAMR